MKSVLNLSDSVVLAGRNAHQLSIGLAMDAFEAVQDDVRP